MATLLQMLALELSYLDNLTEPLPTTLTALQDQITGLSGPDLSGYQTLISDTNKIAISNVNLLSTQLDGKQATLSNASYLDATSSVQTQLNTLTTNVSGKQATLTNGSVSDAMLASTFVKPSTAPTLTGTNFTGIPTSAISSGALTVTSLTNTGLGVNGGISEKFYAITTGTNAFTLDYSTGCVFYLSTGTTLSANFSVSLRNLGATTSQSQTITLMYATTGKYYCNSVTAWTDNGSTQITLSSGTPLYAGGAVPTISASTVMCQTFSILRTFGSNYCITNVCSYA